MSGSDESGVKAPQLRFRIAQGDDLNLLRRFRIECGWGEQRLEQYWGNPDRPLCVFTLGDEDVGMGGWLLELPDPNAASRSTGAVQISTFLSAFSILTTGGLFIRKKYQSAGLGTQAMDLLENAAVEVYGARTLTLETTAFVIVTEDGVDIERFDEPSKQSLWYEKRGYRVYKVRLSHSSANET